MNTSSADYAGLPEGAQVAGQLHMPSYGSSGLKVKFTETLTIEGGVTTTTPERMEPVYAEVRVPRYRRVFTLSRELDPGRIDANLKDGVLTLRIGVMRTLIGRGLVHEVGSDPDSGGGLYATTPLFLERLGLTSLDELLRVIAA